MPMIWGMENKDVPGRSGSTRRAFLSASAVTAVVTTVTLKISKDNVQFGLRAIDQAGHRSPAAFPQVAA